MTFDFTFFGTDEFAVGVLEELKKRGFLPLLIVTAPERPAGRGLKMTQPPVRHWAEDNKVACFQPPNDKKTSREQIEAGMIEFFFTPRTELFVVASYGQIISPRLLAIPRHGTLNVHPSLLPKYRGSSPIQSAILNGDQETGVSIMLLDEAMDHGPILKTETIKLQDQTYLELRAELAKTGGQLLADVMPKWLAGEITALPQDHAAATYTKKIKKEDGLIDLAAPAALNWRKFRALLPWPGLYFFQNDQRIKVTEATLEAGQFVIKKIIPEGGREISY